MAGPLAKPSMQAPWKGHTGEIQVKLVPGEVNMTHFWVRVAMKKLTVHQGAATNAGADGKVNQVARSLPRAPEGFSQHRAIDICIKADGQGGVQSVFQKTDDVGVFPTEFRCGEDVTIVWKIRARVEGTEAGDAQGGQRTEFPLSLKEKFRAGCKRWLGEGGGDADFAEDVVLFISHSADKLCSSSFNTTEEFSVFHAIIIIAKLLNLRKSISSGWALVQQQRFPM